MPPEILTVVFFYGFSKISGVFNGGVFYGVFFYVNRNLRFGILL